MKYLLPEGATSFLYDSPRIESAQDPKLHVHKTVN